MKNIHEKHKELMVDLFKEMCVEEPEERLAKGITTEEYKIRVERLEYMRNIPEHFQYIGEQELERLKEMQFDESDLYTRMLRFWLSDDKFSINSVLPKGITHLVSWAAEKLRVDSFNFYLGYNQGPEFSFKEQDIITPLPERINSLK